MLNRGDRREPIFQDDADRQCFVETLGEVWANTGWQVHAYLLMPNHFHLVVETPQLNLVAAMKWLLGTYTGRFSRWHKLFGHQFSGRYKSLFADALGRGYLKTVCDYVTLNPARAQLAGPDQPLESSAWSSWPSDFWPGRSGQRGCGWTGCRGRIPKDSPAGRQRLERVLEVLEARSGAEQGEEFQPIRRGSCLGEETFRQELLAQMSKRLGAEHCGGERAEAKEAMAERIIAEELKRRRWREDDLDTRSRGDVVKVALAARLRAETTMTVG